LHVAAIIDAFVETPGEFRRDGLRRNTLVGNHFQDEKHIHGRLRTFHLVHRNFGDEVSLAFFLHQTGINFSSLPYGRQEFPGHFLEQCLGYLNRVFDSGNLHLAKIFAARRHECGNVGLAAWLADVGGHIESEKIRGFHERLDCAQVDVVGIDEIFALETQGRHGGIRFAAHVRRVRMNINMLAIRLVPHRADIQSGFIGLHDGAQLRLALARETIANAETVFS